MVLVDSNIFLIDRFFKRDERYDENKRLIESLSENEGAISILTLLELCGVASFNLSQEELATWIWAFDRVYPVAVLDLQSELESDKDINSYLACLGADYITKKMTFGDAILLKEAEAYNVSSIVTWNKKHFEGKTMIPIKTPAEFSRLAKHF